MITKSQLAASIGCCYTTFRRYLRALERGNPALFTGCKHYLTPWQEAFIRDFFQRVPSLEVFPKCIVWAGPPPPFPTRDPATPAASRW